MDEWKERRLCWVRWNPGNPEPYDPPNLAKNEGRGERRYAWELRYRHGWRVVQNTPGQNPDILIEGGPGCEVKELCAWGFRLSGAEEVKFAIFDRVVEPLREVARRRLSPRDFRRLQVLGYISQKPCALLGDFGSEELYEDIFRHSQITHLVVVSEEGYIELTPKELARSFKINKLNGFVPSVFFRPEFRPKRG